MHSLCIIALSFNHSIGATLVHRPIFDTTARDNLQFESCFECREKKKGGVGSWKRTKASRFVNSTSYFIDNLQVHDGVQHSQVSYPSTSTFLSTWNAPRSHILPLGVTLGRVIKGEGHGLRTPRRTPFKLLASFRWRESSLNRLYGQRTPLPQLDSPEFRSR